MSFTIYSPWSTPFATGEAVSFAKTLRLALDRPHLITREASREIVIRRANNLACQKFSKGKRCVDNEVTQLLQAWGDGERDALDKLVPLVYDELRRAARRYMRSENPNHTLQTTALVNEAYLRLVAQKGTRWQNRAHFFAIAAGMMRRILVDHARHRKYAKRGGALTIQLSPDEMEAVAEDKDLDLLKLDEALQELSKIDPRRSRVIELRFFGGLDIKETAEALEVSPATVLRDWNMAKAWLYRYMKDER